MFTLLITAVLLLGLVAVAIYFWQKPANTSQTEQLAPLMTGRGLFDNDEAPAQITGSALLEQNKQQEQALLVRANAKDKGSLMEAHAMNQKVYNAVLDTLVSVLSSDSQLLSLVSFVVQRDLPVNDGLVHAMMESWKGSPDRNSTAKMLHIVALFDDAETYRKAVELVLGAWREEKLRDLSAVELQALLNGEFWVLSSGARNSGAGFVLKRILSSAQRELDEN
jgi:hypothetical protein